MALSRILSCVSKYEELLSDLHEVEKIVSKLQKDATKLKKKFFGSRAKADATKNKINSDDIQNFDCQMLKIQQLLNKFGAIAPALWAPNTACFATGLRQPCVLTWAKSLSCW